MDSKGGGLLVIWWEAGRRHIDTLTEQSHLHIDSGHARHTQHKGLNAHKALYSQTLTNMYYYEG